MINVTKITDGLKEQIESDPNFSGFNIEVGEPVNMDAGNDWIGIYKSNINYKAKYLGKGTGMQNYLGHVTLKIMVQDFNIDDKNAYLDEKVNNVVNAIVNDKTINNTIDMLDEEIDIDYSFIESDDESFYFQMATITIVALKRS